MKFTCLQANLKRAINIVSRAVAPKSTLPVLSNILISTDNGRVKLSATNLEIGIATWIQANIQEEGSTTLPARLLSDVVSNLPSADMVDMHMADEQRQITTITSGRFTTNMHGVSAEEFPSLPEATPTRSLSLPADVLQGAINQVAIAAAGDESRPVLSGVLIRIVEDSGRLTFAAADGFRLARKHIFIDPVLFDIDIIVPASALRTVAQVITETEQVQIGLISSGNQVLFRTEEVEVTSRLIDGKFPDFERIIPSDSHTQVQVKTAALLKAVKMAGLFAKSSQNILKLECKNELEIGKGYIVVSANAAEVGDNTSEVECILTGNQNVIALNVAYLQEALGVLSTEDVLFTMQDARSPGVLRPHNDDGHYLHVIMPMTIRT